jgi:hypothetical protein
MKTVGSRFTVCSLVLLASISGCSNKPPEADTAAAPAAATPAPVVAQAGNSSGSPAKTCSWAGFRWRREVTINPTMTVSNDGYCLITVQVLANTPILMEVETPPQHGHLTTSGEDTSRAALIYLPNSGYVGPDRFAVLTGRAGHEVNADFAVTVIGQ